MKIVNLDNVPEEILLAEYAHLKRETAIPFIHSKFLAEELFISDVWGIYVNDGKICFEVTSKISGSILMIILKSHIIKEGKTYKFSSIRDSDQSILFEFEAQP